MIFEKSDNRLLKFNKIIALIFVIWVCIPWVTQNLRLISGVILAVLWAVSAMILNGDTVKITKDAIFIGVWIFLSLLAFAVTQKIFANYTFIEFAPWAILFFYPFYMMRFYMKRDMTDFLAKLAIVAIVGIFIGQVMTIIFSSTYPGIVKIIEKEDANLFSQYDGNLDFDVVRKWGIGGFGFVYMLMLVMIASVIIFFKCKNKLVKIATAVFFIVGVVCLIMSTYTTSLLLLFVGVIVALINMKKGRKSRIISYITVIIALIISSQIIGNILVNIELSSETLTARLREIGQLLLNGDVGLNIEARLKYLTNSWNAFTQSPLLGTNFVQGSAVTVGTHSEWLDILGSYGLIGGIPLFATLIYKFRSVGKYIKEKTGFRAYGAILFVLFLFGFLDPIIRTYHMGMALFLIIPGMMFIPSLLNRREKEKNEDSLDS